MWTYLAANEAVRQIVRETGVENAELDPSALVYALAILVTLNKTRYARLIEQGLHLVFGSCEDGIFRAGMPFNIDEKGRALFVPSAEIASVALSVYLSQVKDGIMPNGDEAALSASASIAERMNEYINSVEIRTPSGAVKALNGWSNDKAPSRTRVEAWVTIHVVSFFIQRMELLRLARKKSVLAQRAYGWISHDRCKPSWDDVIEPDLGLGGQGIKETIRAVAETGVAQRDTAPVFLLYGPPGTSKTTMVTALAKKLRWDLVMLSPSDFVTYSLDKIEKRSKKIFEDLSDLDECVILMDEMDSLLRDRDSLWKEAPGTIMEFVVPAFLPKLQALRDRVLSGRLALFFVTNYYERIDRAILRSGRVDHHLLVLPYTPDAKEKVLGRFLPNTWIEAGRWTTEGQQKVKAVAKEAHPLQVYRDIEHLGKTMAKHWANPAADRPIHVNRAMKECSIQPEMYRPDERPDAYREVCAIYDRILNKATTASISNPKEAQDHIRAILRDHGGKLPYDWRELAGAWEDRLMVPKGKN